MREPELKTKRLTLRLLSPHYAESLLPIWSDNDVVRFTYMRLVKDITSCIQNIVVMMDSGVKRDDVGPYVILLDGAVIGLTGAVKVSRESFEYELFYHLGRPWWGNGYATEAASAIIGQAMMMPLVHRVCAEVVVENIASVRVLEKSGMQREGRLRGKFCKDGIYRDLYVYSILRNEWQQRKTHESIAAAISSSGSSSTPPSGL